MIRKSLEITKERFWCMHSMAIHNKTKLPLLVCSRCSSKLIKKKIIFKLTAIVSRIFSGSQVVKLPIKTRTSRLACEGKRRRDRRANSRPICKDGSPLQEVFAKDCTSWKKKIKIIIQSTIKCKSSLKLQSYLYMYFGITSKFA